MTVVDPTGEPGHNFAARVAQLTHNPRDPEPFLALYLDAGVPMDDEAKAALVLDSLSFSRRYLLAFIKPLARTALVFVALFRLIIPRALTSSRLLHRLIYWGLKNFVSPEANFMIMRHFHLGSDVLGFLAANAPVKVPTSPLRPLDLADLRDDTFLKHDLNLFNFIINLNQELRREGKGLCPPDEVDFSTITDSPIGFAPFPHRFTNFLDLVSSIELYTPLFYLFLGHRDFMRASHSLQLDETVAIEAAQILGDGTHLALLNNRHPLIPLSVFRAGYRLVIHGLATEMLHGVLRTHKRVRAESHADASGNQAAGLQALWTRGKDERL